MFFVLFSFVAVPPLEHPTDEGARGNRHSAGLHSHPAISRRVLGPCEGCYCSAWLNRRRDEVGRLTDEVGTSLVSMHWSSGELQPMKQTAPRSPSFPQLSTIYYTAATAKLQTLSLLPSHDSLIRTPMSAHKEHPPAHLPWTHYCIDCTSAGTYHVKTRRIRCQFLKLWIKRVKAAQNATPRRNIKANPLPRTASTLKQTLQPRRFEYIYLTPEKTSLTGLSDGDYFVLFPKK